jgi:hypothetical protein
MSLVDSPSPERYNRYWVKRDAPRRATREQACRLPLVVSSTLTLPARAVDGRCLLAPFYFTTPYKVVPCSVTVPASDFALTARVVCIQGPAIIMDSFLLCFINHL